MLLDGKIALITGAARGIGANCAKTFAQNGVKALILADINEELGAKMAKELSGACKCDFIKTDVSKEADVLAVYEKIMDTYGRLDILVNVAGICSTKTFFEASTAEWDRMMEINLKSVLLFGREALSIMNKQQYGRIVSMASISGQVGGIRTSPAYAASKAGIICMTKTFAKVGAPNGVTANSIAPGLVDTDMTNDPDFHYSVSEVPMGRVAQPEEISDVALFLASDLSRYVTGQCISVSGGMFMG